MEFAFTLYPDFHLIPLSGVLLESSSGAALNLELYSVGLAQPTLTWYGLQRCYESN